MGNKILLPDGSRFWDRSTMNPHKLVSYEYPEYSKNLYQTGGFWIMRRDTYESHKWNSSLEIYADKRGQLNEDIELSLRILKSGISLSFDKNNYVWHYDESYTEYNSQTLKKEKVAEILQINKSFLDKDVKEEFKNYVKSLTN